MRKLNLGCGCEIIDGYENYDFFPVNDDVRFLDLNHLPLDLPDDYADEIILDNVIEHLDVNPMYLVQDLHRVLKKDGIIKIRLPAWSNYCNHKRFYHTKSYFDPITNDYSRHKNYVNKMYDLNYVKGKGSSIWLFLKRIFAILNVIRYKEIVYELKKN